MEENTLENKKRRRRSVRIKRQSLLHDGKLVLEEPLKSEATDLEQIPDTCSGLKSADNGYGSMWMETNSPHRKKDRRRSRCLSDLPVCSVALQRTDKDDILPREISRSIEDRIPTPNCLSDIAKDFNIVQKSESTEVHSPDSEKDMIHVGNRNVLSSPLCDSDTKNTSLSPCYDESSCAVGGSHFDFKTYNYSAYTPTNLGFPETPKHTTPYSPTQPVIRTISPPSPGDTSFSSVYHTPIAAHDQLASPQLLNNDVWNTCKKSVSKDSSRKSVTKRRMSDRKSTKKINSKASALSPQSSGRAATAFLSMCKELAGKLASAVRKAPESDDAETALTDLEDELKNIDSKSSSLLTDKSVDKLMDSNELEIRPVNDVVSDGSVIEGCADKDSTNNKKRLVSVDQDSRVNVEELLLSQKYADKRTNDSQDCDTCEEKDLNNIESSDDDLISDGEVSETCGEKKLNNIESSIDERFSDGDTCKVKALDKTESVDERVNDVETCIEKSENLVESSAEEMISDGEVGETCREKTLPVARMIDGAVEKKNDMTFSENTNCENYLYGRPSVPLLTAEAIRELDEYLGIGQTDGDQASCNPELVKTIFRNEKIQKKKPKGRRPRKVSKSELNEKNVPGEMSIMNNETLSPNNETFAVPSLTLEALRELDEYLGISEKDCTMAGVDEMKKKRGRPRKGSKSESTENSAQEEITTMPSLTSETNGKLDEYLGINQKAHGDTDQPSLQNVAMSCSKNITRNDIKDINSDFPEMDDNVTKESTTDKTEDDSQPSIRTRKLRRRSTEFYKQANVENLLDSNDANVLKEQNCNNRLISVSSRKGKTKKSEEENIEDIYKNKNFKAPVPKIWETIYEDPTQHSDQIFGKKRFRRAVTFETVAPTKAKRRLQKAIKMGWDAKKRRRMSLSNEAAQNKIAKMEQELAENCDL